jgi:glycosyltransferase involved in cell wall biosynthesis
VTAIHPRVRASAPVPGLVSVVMATYKCRPYIAQAIASVLAQSYTNFELHIVDDGSTDGTAVEVAPFLADRRVHYHYQENGGQTVAKNAGIRQSRGEFIAFCDADDVWLPHKLEVQLPRFGRNARVGVVYSRTGRMDAEGARLEIDESDAPRCPSGQVTPDLFKLNFVPFGTAVVRRRCLDELGAFDEHYRMGIDWELWLRLSVHYEFDFVDTETYVYRVWPGQMSSDWRGRYDHAFRIMHEFLARNPGAIAPGAVRDAWSHCYAQRARLRTALSGEHSQALQDVARALGLQPTSRFAWKTLPAVMLAATGLRNMSSVHRTPKVVRTGQ